MGSPTAAAAVVLAGAIGPPVTLAARDSVVGFIDSATRPICKE